MKEILLMKKSENNNQGETLEFGDGISKIVCSGVDHSGV